MTEYVQLAVPAPPPVAFPSLVAASASAQPNLSSGLAEAFRQSLEGAAGTPQLTTADGGAPGNDFFGQLIDANMQGARYKFLSQVCDQPTVNLPRLLQRIQGFVF